MPLAVGFIDRTLTVDASTSWNGDRWHVPERLICKPAYGYRSAVSKSPK